MAQFYVYCHLRKDTNKPFYYGKGQGKRAFSNQNRNTYWHNIVNKHGYDVLILWSNLNERDALNKEKQVIRANRFFGSELANLTDGGDGLSGYKFTADQKQRLSDSHKGYVPTDKQRHLQSKNNTGKVRTEFHKHKYSLSKIGAKNPMARKVIDLATGFVWSCITEAAEANELKVSTLSKYLSGKRKNITSMRLLNE